MHLWERDCSIQRRHQKLVEEAPSPCCLTPATREMAEAAIALIRKLKYEGAGTIEFIYDLDSGRWYFIEMNTRIQVEHPVTEEIFGVDLVAEQIRVAAGEPYRSRNRRRPTDVVLSSSASMPRIRPTIFARRPAWCRHGYRRAGQGIRLDSHVYTNYVVPPYYDSLLGKLIISGDSRKDVLATAASALARFRVTGVTTTIPFHARLIGCEPFIEAPPIRAGWSRRCWHDTQDFVDRRHACAMRINAFGRPA